jgi:hypothetical protein
MLFSGCMRQAYDFLLVKAEQNDDSIFIYKHKCLNAFTICPQDVIAV